MKTIINKALYITDTLLEENFLQTLVENSNGDYLDFPVYLDKPVISNVCSSDFTVVHLVHKKRYLVFPKKAFSYSHHSLNVDLIYKMTQQYLQKIHLIFKKFYRITKSIYTLDQDQLTSTNTISLVALKSFVMQNSFGQDLQVALALEHLNKTQILKEMQNFKGIPLRFKHVLNFEEQPYYLNKITTLICPTQEDIQNLLIRKEYTKCTHKK